MTAAAAPPPPPGPAVDADPRKVLRSAAAHVVAGAPAALFLDALDARTRADLARRLAPPAPDPLLRLAPPHDKGAERAVLGALLIDDRAIDEVASLLRPEQLYVPAHVLVYTAILGLRREGKPVDVLTVREALERKGVLEEAGDVAALAELTEAVPTSANAAHYAGIVRDHAMRRDVIRMTAEVQRAAFDGSTPVAELGARAASVASVGSTSTRATGADMARELWEAIERAQRGEVRLGFLTGYPGVDDMTQGLQPGELSAIGARSSMGKTTYALALVARLVERGHRVGIVSLEMPRLQLARNIAASRARVDGQRVRSGVFDRDEQGRVVEAVEWLAGIGDRLLVDDAPPAPAGTVLARVRSLVARDRCDVVFLDYLQLVQLQDPRQQHAELGAVSSGLKAITRAHPEAHVCAIAQLNREVEKRRDRSPMLSDLAGSGQLENDLDLAMLLLRPSYYDKGADPRLLEVHVAKQRNGPTGVLQLSFDRSCLRIEDAPPEGFAVPEKPKRRRFGKGRKDDAGDAQE